MKKLIVMLLALCLLLTLAACGGKEEAPVEEVQITAQPKVESNAAPVETPAAPTAAPTEAAPAETEADLKALAESCIDKNVSDLYALIGEPESSEYAPSCLVEGEDGTLYYEGFVVYTTREGEVETVYYVE